MAHPVNVQIQISDDLLSDVLTTAVEGGIGYWSAVTDCERVNGGERDLCWLSVTLAPYPDDEWGVFDLNDKRPLVVTLRDVARGIELILTNKVGIRADLKAQVALALGNPEDADIDADAADCIIQAACFGEIVFG
jgi:hypothetical protein